MPRHSVVDADVLGEDTSLSLEAHEQAVNLIDSEIETLMRTVRQLQFRKLQHQNHVRYSKGLTTLARKLPSELLARIFQECINDGWTRTPLITSHVCPEWRKAARNPMIWTRIYVNCVAKDPYGRTSLWLRNAQTCPLSITLEVSNDGSCIPGIMAILLTKAAQWRALTINTTFLRHANEILRTFNDRKLPELDVIYLSLMEEFSESDGLAGDLELGLTSSNTLPRLTRVTISRNILPSQPAFPQHITDLCLILTNVYTQTRSSVQRLLSVLQPLKALRKFSVLLPYGQSREFEPVADQSHRAELPTLHSLELTGSPAMLKILSHLFVPSLVHLHLRSSLDPLGYPDEETGLIIKNFIELAAPPLQSLELHDIDLSPFAFTECFARLPYLKELRLHESDISDLIIEMFHARCGYCPLLERIDLRWCGQVSGIALVNLVRDRLAYRSSYTEDMSNVACISLITMINCLSVREQDIVDLARMTTCRLVMSPDDYCRPLGCCQNERYRRRLHQHGILRSLEHCIES